MNSSIKNRFRFYLMDFVVAIFVAGINALLLNWLLVRFSHPDWPRSAIIAFGADVRFIAIAMVVTLFVHFLTVCFANWRNYTSAVRAIFLSWSTFFGFWLLLYIPGFLFFSPGLKSHATPSWQAVRHFCDVYVVAQRMYFEARYEGDSEYAQSLMQLYESKPGAGDRNIIGDYFAKAECPTKTPCHGYIFKILKAQGSSAKDGKISYLTLSKDGTRQIMTRGFALVASPDPYQGCQTPTFIVNQDGTTYECDLGTDTSKVFTNMTEFDPITSGDNVWVKSDP